MFSFCFFERITSMKKCSHPLAGPSPMLLDVDLDLERLVKANGLKIQERRGRHIRIVAVHPVGFVCQIANAQNVCPASKKP
jgi:hypothetical protein